MERTWGQDMRHAPTADQCRADIAVWKARSRANITSLSFKTLFQRSNYLSECSQVFRDAQDRDGSEWAHTIWGTYEHHALQRALNFLERKMPKAREKPTQNGKTLSEDSSKRDHSFQPPSCKFVPGPKALRAEVLVASPILPTRLLVSNAPR
jgi:hypothetical protein